jgi:hypothetical protein
MYQAAEILRYARSFMCLGPSPVLRTPSPRGEDRSFAGASFSFNRSGIYLQGRTQLFLLGLFKDWCMSGVLFAWAPHPPFGHPLPKERGGAALLHLLVLSALDYTYRVVRGCFTWPVQGLRTRGVLCAWAPHPSSGHPLPKERGGEKLRWSISTVAYKLKDLALQVLHADV